MNREWKTILRFSAVGFIAGIIGGFGMLMPNLDLSVTAVSLIVCPASILAMPFAAWFFEAAEAGTLGFYVLWLVIALANAVLYSLAGAAWVGLRKQPPKPVA